VVGEVVVEHRDCGRCETVAAQSRLGFGGGAHGGGNEF
jgi:hypothetical protein